MQNENTLKAVEVRLVNHSTLVDELKRLASIEVEQSKSDRISRLQGTWHTGRASAFADAVKLIESVRA